MRDIETLLRSVASNIELDLSSGELMAAADEIERLRAENEKLRERCAMIADSYACAIEPSTGWTQDFRDGYETGVADVSRFIAAAIRESGDERHR